MLWRVYNWWMGGVMDVGVMGGVVIGVMVSMASMAAIAVLGWWGMGLKGINQDIVAIREI
ncbi:MAG: hypothetical protein GX963_05780 [Bacteroidales bacterium]|nr:hypothetical protein [Bacteroidales bacterium]